MMSSEGKVPPADSFPSLEELNEDEEQVLVYIFSFFLSPIQQLRSFKDGTSCFSGRE